MTGSEFMGKKDSNESYCKSDSKQVNSDRNNSVLSRITTNPMEELESVLYKQTDIPMVEEFESVIVVKEVVESPIDVVGIESLHDVKAGKYCHLDNFIESSKQAKLMDTWRHIGNNIIVFDSNYYADSYAFLKVYDDLIKDKHLLLNSYSDNNTVLTLVGVDNSVADLRMLHHVTYEEYISLFITRPNGGNRNVVQNISDVVSLECKHKLKAFSLDITKLMIRKPNIPNSDVFYIGAIESGSVNIKYLQYRGLDLMLKYSLSLTDRVKVMVFSGKIMSDVIVFIKDDCYYEPLGVYVIDMDTNIDKIEGESTSQLHKLYANSNKIEKNFIVTLLNYEKLNGRPPEKIIEYVADFINKQPRVKCDSDTLVCLSREVSNLVKRIKTVRPFSAKKGY